MKDISKLSSHFAEQLNVKILNKLVETHREVCEKIYQDIVDSAPVVTGRYRDSIKISETEQRDSTIETKITTNLKVGGDNPRWADVLLAHFINWGTGPLGESTNIFPHNYPYTTNEPWDFITWAQYRATGTWGMHAYPHFYMSLENNKDYYKKKIKEVVKNA